MFIKTLVKENMNKLKGIINKNKPLKLAIVISSLIFPSIFILNFADIVSIDYINFFDTLWIGFYSCIFLLCFIDLGSLNLLRIIIIMLNIGVILTTMIASLMGGLQGLIIVIIKMLLPIMPFDWISNFVFKVLGYPNP